MSSDFAVCVGSCFSTLVTLKNNSNVQRALQCISGLVHTRKSDDDASIDWVLLIAALATGDELELSVHLLWLAQETSEKNTPNVLLCVTSAVQATADAHLIQAQHW